MSVFKSIQAIIAIITLASVSAGCAALSTASQKPRVSLASIRVLDIKGLETTFEIDLRIINRSQQSLNITGIDCELTLNGRQLAEGVANPKDRNRTVHRCGRAGKDLLIDARHDRHSAAPDEVCGKTDGRGEVHLCHQRPPADRRWRLVRKRPV
jgi:LEA14-like dessication related protein